MSAVLSPIACTPLSQMADATTGSYGRADLQRSMSELHSEVIATWKDVFVERTGELELQILGLDTVCRQKTTNHGNWFFIIISQLKTCKISTGKSMQFACRQRASRVFWLYAMYASEHAQAYFRASRAYSLTYLSASTTDSHRT
jgi:hypothetical protein